MVYDVRGVYISSRERDRENIRKGGGGKRSSCKKGGPQSSP
jgi:hypothetical protein